MIQKPPAQCRHHDPTCSDIVQANEDLAEALKKARAEIERLKTVTSRLENEADTEKGLSDLRKILLDFYGQAIRRGQYPVAEIVHDMICNLVQTEYFSIRYLRS